jgi:hypothetical protein
MQGKIIPILDTISTVFLSLEKPVNYATTTPARTTPDFLMFHTSSKLKKY